MWKITRLYLKNFININTGINKKEITLDFSNCDKKINIFIGKMGSGKSSILGQLQPFSSYGSLDVRNQQPLIIPEEDGIKEIIYSHYDIEYFIQHKYIWNSKTLTHNVKSYISKNGVELNENGNVSSFKELIKIEFGIDQNFLRLIRLGPNVANLINMKSTERKKFISTLLKDTEIYTMLYQKLSEDHRNINSMISMLSNKLIGLNSDKLEDMKKEKENLSEDIESLQINQKNISDKISKLNGINSTLLNESKSISEYKSLILSLSDKYNSYINRLNDINDILNKINEEKLNHSSPAIELGKIFNKLDSIDEEIINLQSKLQSIEKESNQIKNKILIIENNNQLAELENRVKTIEEKYKNSSTLLYNFNSSYSYNYLTNFMNTIETFQISLEDMCVNSKEVIDKIFFSDNTLKQWATKRMSILERKKSNLMNSLKNIEFSKDYEIPVLFIPPLCPTRDCPYYKTHPANIKKNTKKNINSKMNKIMDDIDVINKEMNIVQDVIIQIPKMKYLKDMWNIISKTLDTMNCLKENNLYKLITDIGCRNNWYDRIQFMNYLNKVKLQEGYKELENQYYKAKNELFEFKNSGIDQLKDTIINLNIEYNDIIDRLEFLQNDKNDLNRKKDELSNLLSSLSEKDKLIQEKNKLEIEIIHLNKDIDTKHDNVMKIERNIEKIKELQYSLSNIQIEYNTKYKRCNDLVLKIQDIINTNKDFEEYSKQRKIIKLLLDAVSSKDGIPLVIIKVFLDDCRDIINDLISDIFNDELEICDFDISLDSNEFNIPYIKNGNKISDIELASQGEQSIISIALSFALCRKAMFDYNIMLLDEIDNSIYKDDRERFITILAKQMMAMGTEQVFLITHNDIFQQSGLPVNIIMTTNENIDIYDNQTIMKIS